MSSLGKNFRITIFGASHGEAVGVVMEGLPVGFAIDMDALSAFLARRAPGRGAFATARRETDAPHFLSGVKNGVTCGGAVTAVIRNSDAHPGDYEALRNTPRPGHADFTARIKEGDAVDLFGGGRFSGRLTAPLCIAGGIAMQLLEEKNIRVVSHIASIAGIADEGLFPASTLGKPFPTLSEARGEDMLAAIAKARADGDSVGGVVECAVLGLPAGLGDALFDGVESRLSAALFGIPAVKGVEFGTGFAAAALRGSENNDAFVLRGGKAVTETNRCGGILGGITTGAPLVFRVAFKPTPSIARRQRTVDLAAMRETTVEIAGRHDPCIVPRAVPCVEAAAAVVLYDILCSERGRQPLTWTNCAAESTRWTTNFCDALPSVWTSPGTSPGIRPSTVFRCLTSGGSGKSSSP